MNSLKEQLCIRGRQLLYQYCDENSVPYKKIGKLVVARKGQESYVQSLHDKARQLHQITQSLPTHLLTGSKAKKMEPNLSSDITAALYSPETGILDSHSFMQSLEQHLKEAENAEVLTNTSVVRIDPYPYASHTSQYEDGNGWVIQMITPQPNGTEVSDGDSILARTLVNAAGLSGTLILNSLLPVESRIPMYYARGSYASYRGPGVEGISRLLYPCPEAKKDKHSFQSLGTHLTLDLSGNIKFGPDLQWISPGRDGDSEASPVATEDNELREQFLTSESDAEFWKQKLNADDIQLEEMCRAVRGYLPNVQLSHFRPDYVGIRPKLVPPWGGFQDFVFRRDHATDFLQMSSQNRRGVGTMISLLGIESPGLTASLAIAEKTVSMLDE